MYTCFLILLLTTFNHRFSSFSLFCSFYVHSRCFRFFIPHNTYPSFLLFLLRHILIISSFFLHILLLCRYTPHSVFSRSFFVRCCLSTFLLCTQTFCNLSSSTQHFYQLFTSVCSNFQTFHVTALALYLYMKLDAWLASSILFQHH